MKFRSTSCWTHQSCVTICTANVVTTKGVIKQTRRWPRKSRCQQQPKRAVYTQSNPHPLVCIHWLWHTILSYVIQPDCIQPVYIKLLLVSNIWNIPFKIACKCIGVLCIYCTYSDNLPVFFAQGHVLKPTKCAQNYQIMRTIIFAYLRQRVTMHTTMHNTYSFCASPTVNTVNPAGTALQCRNHYAIFMLSGSFLRTLFVHSKESCNYAHNFKHIDGGTG